MVLGDEDKKILGDALTEINGLTPDQISAITAALNCLPSLSILSSSIQAKRRSLSVKKTVEKGIQPLSTSQKLLPAQRRTPTWSRWKQHGRCMASGKMSATDLLRPLSANQH